jgi:hypothetical protein
MSRFPTDAHLASCGGKCPANANPAARSAPPSRDRPEDPHRAYHVLNQG